MHGFIAPALALVFSLSPISGQGPAVAGTWKVEGDVMSNPVNMVCTIKQEQEGKEGQEGATLTGSCKSPDRDKPSEIKGVLKEKKVSWKFDSEYNGELLIVTFTGTLDGAEIKGDIDIQPMSVTGTFTAKKETGK